MILVKYGCQGCRGRLPLCIMPIQPFRFGGRFLLIRQDKLYHLDVRLMFFYIKDGLDRHRVRHVFIAVILRRLACAEILDLII